MAVQTVFSSNLDPAQENLTARFTNATAFYIDAPLLSVELEIDVFLQVYFPVVTGERVRNLPLGKIEEQAILLNVTDTQSVVTIPSEYVDSGLEMALLFLASSTTFLEVYVLGKDCTVCSLDTKLDAILDNVETIGGEDFQNALLQFAVNNLLPLIALTVLPGVNNLLVSVVMGLLLPAIQQLLPGGGTPVLPSSINSIALLGTNTQLGNNGIANNSSTNIRFT